jgi:hypothetical protein
VNSVWVTAISLVSNDDTHIRKVSAQRLDRPGDAAEQEARRHG